MLIVDLLREKKTSQVLLQLVLPILRKLRKRIELSLCESISILCRETSLDYWVSKSI